VSSVLRLRIVADSYGENSVCIDNSMVWRDPHAKKPALPDKGLFLKLVSRSFMMFSVGVSLWGDPELQKSIEIRRWKNGPEDVVGAGSPMALAAAASGAPFMPGISTNQAPTTASASRSSVLVTSSSEEPSPAGAGDSAAVARSFGLPASDALSSPASGPATETAHLDSGKNTCLTVEYVLDILIVQYLVLGDQSATALVQQQTDLKSEATGNLLNALDASAELVAVVAADESNSNDLRQSRWASTVYSPTCTESWAVPVQTETQHFLYPLDILRVPD